MEDLKTALNFAFGLGIWGNPVVDIHGGESALELGMGIQAVCRRAVPKERKSVGIEASRQAVLLQEAAQMDKVAPGGVTGNKDATEDFPRMIVKGENKCGIMLGRPPRVRRGIVLPEFTNGGALPATTRFWATFKGGHQLRELLPDVGGHGGTGAPKPVPAFEFISQEGEIQRLAMRQYLSQELAGWGRPIGTMISAGGSQRKAFLVPQPLMTQTIEPTAPDHQSFRRRICIQQPGVEGGEDFLDKKR